MSVKIVITQWALDAYLNLKHHRVFYANEFKNNMRPDVLLLREFPNHPKFDNGKFWSDANIKNVRHGYKMKWRQVGNGRVQLRLPVAILGDESFLCEAYVKLNDKVDARKLAKFKVHIQLIMQHKFKQCGVVS
jgi:hypothetical protein